MKDDTQDTFLYNEQTKKNSKDKIISDNRYISRTCQ